jgi:hypothetical protein
MHIGDLVLGLIALNGLDKRSAFASSVTAGTTPGITTALVQNSQNLSGVNIIALMQRRTSVSLNTSVDVTIPISADITVDLQT